jgi:hypothetical protein
MHINPSLKLQSVAISLWRAGFKILWRRVASVSPNHQEQSRRVVVQIVLYRWRKKAVLEVGRTKNIPQGLKPAFLFRRLRHG